MLCELISKHHPALSIHPADSSACFSRIYSRYALNVGAYIVLCRTHLSFDGPSSVQPSIFSFISERKKRKRDKEKPSALIEEPEFDIYEEDPEEFTIRETRPKPASQPRPLIRKIDETGYQLPSLDFLKDVDDVPGPTKKSSCRLRQP